MSIEFSGKEIPVEIFLDLLKALKIHGWHKAGPIDKNDLDLMPTVNFHVDEGSADQVLVRFERGFSIYHGKTKWVLRRESNNRFFLCPEELAESADGTSLASRLSLRKNFPEVGRAANDDLIALSNAIYQAALIDDEMGGLYADND
jgi:hypothetical protein